MSRNWKPALALLERADRSARIRRGAKRLNLLIGGGDQRERRIDLTPRDALTIAAVLESAISECEQATRDYPPVDDFEAQADAERLEHLRGLRDRLQRLPDEAPVR